MPVVLTKEIIDNLKSVKFERNEYEREADWFVSQFLELPDLGNERRVSRIPEGSYKCKKHKSPKFGLTLWLQDVQNRSEILIHKGNYHTDILGCVIIGTDIKDINNDGYKDVVNSKNAIKYLLSYLEDVNGIMIEIV